MAWAKAAFTPVLSEEAEQLMAGYYQLRRQAEGRQVGRAHAKLITLHALLINALPPVRAAHMPRSARQPHIVGHMPCNCDAG